MSLCNANIESETGNPLVLWLTSGEIPNRVTLVGLQVQQLGGYKREYYASQPTHAFVGPINNQTFGSTVTLFARVQDHSGFADCYVSGELIN